MNRFTLANHSTRLMASLALAAILLIGCVSTTDAREAPAREEIRAEKSVKPGINESFLKPDLNVGEFVERFEGESREIFANRKAITQAIGLQPGDRIVDVGAGTGPFIGLFAAAVGEQGKVYAIDIAPNFVDHLAQRAKREGFPQIEARLCSEKSVDLPKESVTRAFICDVYHHFEYPRSTMGSVHSALRQGGEVIIVDFERIPGVSSEWILGHVRAGKSEVFAEMQQFGFEFVEEITIAGLKENWVARFRKR
ncbi:MAG: class I SAM-dependent methyltransferase [Planctomycetota bacterium]